MACMVIPFPETRVFRSQDLIIAIEKLAYCESASEAKGDDPEAFAKRCIGGGMRDFWEAEVQRLGGMPKILLKRDGLDA